MEAATVPAPSGPDDGAQVKRLLGVLLAHAVAKSREAAALRNELLALRNQRADVDSNTPSDGAAAHTVESSPSRKSSTSSLDSPDGKAVQIRVIDGCPQCVLASDDPLTHKILHHFAAVPSPLVASNADILCPLDVFNSFLTQQTGTESATIRTINETPTGIRASEAAPESTGINEVTESAPSLGDSFATRAAAEAEVASHEAGSPGEADGASPQIQSLAAFQPARQRSGSPTSSAAQHNKSSSPRRSTSASRTKAPESTRLNWLAISAGGGGGGSGSGLSPRGAYRSERDRIDDATAAGERSSSPYARPARLPPVPRQSRSPPASGRRSPTEHAAASLSSPFQSLATLQPADAITSLINHHDNYGNVRENDSSGSERNRRIPDADGVVAGTVRPSQSSDFSDDGTSGKPGALDDGSIQQQQTGSASESMTFIYSNTLDDEQGIQHDDSDDDAEHYRRQRHRHDGRSGGRDSLLNEANAAASQYSVVELQQQRRQSQASGGRNFKTQQQHSTSQTKSQPAQRGRTRPVTSPSSNLTGGAGREGGSPTARHAVVQLPDGAAAAGRAGGASSRASMSSRSRSPKLSLSGRSTGNGIGSSNTGSFAAAGRQTFLGRIEEQHRKESAPRRPRSARVDSGASAARTSPSRSPSRYSPTEAVQYLRADKRLQGKLRTTLIKGHHHNGSNSDAPSPRTQAAAVGLASSPSATASAALGASPLQSRGAVASPLRALQSNSGRQPASSPATPQIAALKNTRISSIGASGGANSSSGSGGRRDPMDALSTALFRVLRSPSSSTTGNPSDVDGKGNIEDIDSFLRRLGVSLPADVAAEVRHNNKSSGEGAAAGATAAGADGGAGGAVPSASLSSTDNATTASLLSALSSARRKAKDGAVAGVMVPTPG